jgi:hypothetical protein
MKKRRLGSSVPSGEYEAICLRAVRHTSAAGNPCVRWTWALLPDAVIVEQYTVIRRAETGKTAQALGLPLRPLRLADAQGRRARVTVANGDFGPKVTAARPSGPG